jgi:hypothetical protein
MTIDILSGDRIMATKRSPNYPQITLEEAVQAAENIYREDMRNKMSQKTVSSHLGYTSVNGRSLAKIGALKAYDLLEGRGQELKLTDRAVNLIAETKNSPVGKKILYEAAFSPSVFKELNEYYEGRKASAENLRSELIKRGFTLDAVDKVSKIYLANYDLVTQSGGGYSPETEVASAGEAETEDSAGQDDGLSTPAQKIKVGDYVQWESGGVLQFKDPRQVRAIQSHQGKEWVFVKGSSGGIPMEQAIFEGKAMVGIATQPPALPEQPEDFGVPQAKDTIKAICPLEEGDAILVLPKNLSKASYEDLEYWFKGELRKAARKANVSKQKATEE